MLFSASGLHREYGEKILFQDVSFSIDEKEKVALIGVNGCGKSTLLKTIAAQDESAGSYSHARDFRIRLLPQNPVFHTGTVWEEMLEQNRKLDHPRQEYELKSILTQLGLEDLNMPIDSMSGGQQRRLSLALALSDQADLLLLDEPTNHLDADMCAWLENWLNRTTQSVLMITHDRYFLESVCSRILELDQGHLYEHKGSFASYLEDKEKREEEAQAAARKNRNLYRHELEWVRAGVQARSTKSKSRLDRFEQLRKERMEIQNRSLNLESLSSRLGRKTIEWENLSFGYDKDHPLFTGFSFHCKRTDRLGFTGPNGCGKTTLLKLIAGELQPDSGFIEQGETIRIGWFRQNMEIEDLSVRVLDYIEEKARVLQTASGEVPASAMLERFLFDKNLQYLPIERLSGGERRRLSLLKVLMEAPNVLILDEPTNDLDIVTLEILENYLDEFNGIVILVSHDRYFMDRICTDLFVFEEGTIRRYTGGYSDYLLEKKAQQETVKTDTVSRGRKEWKNRTRPGLKSAQKRELEQIPQQLESLQSQADALVEQMGETSDFEQLQQLSLQRDEIQKQIEALEERWLELEELKEQSTGE